MGVLSLSCRPPEHLLSKSSVHLCIRLLSFVSFPGGAWGQEPACQCRRHHSLGFDPSVGKIPWRRKWQPTPGFLLGESHGQRSLAGCSPWGRERLSAHPPSSAQSFSRVWLFATPWTAARQASLSITNSRSLPKLMSIESVMPSNHLILCRPLLLPPSIFPSIRVFSNESVLHIRRRMRTGTPPPVFLSGESQGRGSLVGCRLWGRTVGYN